MRGIGLLLLLITISCALTSCASYHSRDTEFTAQQRAEMQSAKPAKQISH